MIDKASERIKPNLDIEKKQGKIGVLGLTPQDISDLQAPKKIREYYQEKKEGKKQSATAWEKMSAGARMVLIIIEQQERLKKNIVVSPAALAAAKYLEKHLAHLMRSLTQL